MKPDLYNKHFMGRCKCCSVLSSELQILASHYIFMQGTTAGQIPTNNSYIVQLLQVIAAFVILLCYLIIRGRLD
jgi:hypothetical protein